jgi:hypothetical protein
MLMVMHKKTIELSGNGNFIPGAVAIVLVNESLKVPLHYMRTANYNILSDQKQEKVTLALNGVTVYELWPVGESSYSSDMKPSEVLDLIEGRFLSYLYVSGAEDTRRKIQAIRSGIAKADRVWLLQRALELEAEASKLRNQARA